MTDLLVGCPAANRGWIIPAWLDHIADAALVAGVTPRFIVAADPGDDAWAALAPVADRLTRVELDDPRTTDLHDWTGDRFHRMVTIRNELLAAVRREQPDVFLSLDTDVLIHPAAIANLLDTGADFDAVGGYCYMDASRRCPSWGRLTYTGSIDRSNVPGYVGPVDIIMAIKAMRPRAYQVDYRWHSKGEDVGICVAWREANVRIGLDARVTNKHVMQRRALGQIDPRCGY